MALNKLAGETPHISHSERRPLQPRPFTRPASPSRVLVRRFLSGPHSWTTRPWNSLPPCWRELQWRPVWRIHPVGNSALVADGCSAIRGYGKEEGMGLNGQHTFSPLALRILAAAALSIFPLDMAAMRRVGVDAGIKCVISRNYSRAWALRALVYRRIGRNAKRRNVGCGSQGEVVSKAFSAYGRVARMTEEASLQTRGTWHPEARIYSRRWE